MDALLQHAGQILETAAEGQEAEGLLNHPSEYLIAVLRAGSIRMFADAGGWALPALAAEYGASAVYRVTRRPRSVRVEAWSAGSTCLLTRELAVQHASGATPRAFIARQASLLPSLA
jgi:hypothetical protein